MMLVELEKKPIAMMTGEELRFLLGSGNVQQEEVKNDHPIERVKIKGIRGLMKFLNDCSSTTAQKVKDSGKFPVYWIGNRFYCYSDEVELGLKDWKGDKENGRK